MKRFIAFIRKHAIAVALISAAVVALLLVLYSFHNISVSSATPDTSNLPPRAVPGVATLRDPLTGYPVVSASPLPRVSAVMIDDMVDAWPQSGVNQAFLVIEAPVEGGIPRLIAFFGEGQTVPKIGPVRSARPYFIDWADEFDAMYAHVGGSDAALAILSAGGTFDLNQFSNGTYFWRSTDRVAPHNVYTSTQLLANAWQHATTLGTAPTPNYGVWQFKDAAAVPAAEPVSPDINFSTPDYHTHWTFDPKTDEYTRSEAGLPFVMDDGTPVVADNVAVVATDISTIDPIGHRQIRTIGTGDALIFQDGNIIKGTWQKPSAQERLRFYNPDGTEVQMNAGKTWIEIVPSLDLVTY